MNKVIFMGRLKKDADIRYTNDGKCIANFDIAVDRRFAKQGETDVDFFNCSAFSKTAEIIEKCKVAKGTKVLIEGEARNNNYTDKNGVKHYGTQILVNSFEFCESKGANASVQQTKPDADGFVNIPDSVTDEELPFI